MKKILIISILAFSFFSGSLAFAQNGYGLGASVLFNANTNAIGAGLRGQIPVWENLSAVPYIYYFFTTGEFAGGVAAQYPFYDYGNFNFYAIAAGTFKAKVSVSVSDSTSKSNKSYRSDGEVGIGMLYGKFCFKPFFEPRYKISEKQAVLRLGVMYFFGCKIGKKSSKGHKIGAWKGSKQHPVCPAYN